MLTKVLAFAVLAATALAQYTINTPAALTECQPSLITWVGGQAPFILSAIPAGQTGAAAIANIAEGINANQFSWTVNLPVNTALTLKLVDATGNTAYTSPLTVFKGSSTACLNGGGSSASGGASSGASAASSGAPAASSAGPAGTSSGAPAASSSGAAPTSAAPAASSGGASASAGGASSSVSHAPSGSASGAASGASSAPSPSASKPSSAARTAVAALPLVAAGVAAAYFL